MSVLIPKGYRNILENVENTQKGIKLVKDMFQSNLSAQLVLLRVTAPIMVLKGTGINDDLNGVERPVTFPVKDLNESPAEVVQSLAKWKRVKLSDMKMNHNRGIYTDMNAIRPDEVMDNIHSIYVDQWDWERVVSADERNLDFLKKIVRKIYSTFLRTEFMVTENFPQITPMLPEEITFYHAEELEELYPALSPKEREHEVSKKHGAVFIIGIGGLMPGGEKHDGRAPDYDDWTTPTINNYKGLNGDILVWNPVMETSLELSSMGIRVDKDALLKQLALTGTEERKNLYWHKRLLNDELPLSIGGGIGQSRLCMYFLRKAHIGEIQSSIWPDEMKVICKKNRIELI